MTELPKENAHSFYAFEHSSNKGIFLILGMREWHDRVGNQYKTYYIRCLSLYASNEPSIHLVIRYEQRI